MPTARLSAIVLLAILQAALLPVAAAQAEDEKYAPAPIALAALLDRNRHAAGALESGAYHEIERDRSSKGDVWTTESFWIGDDFRTTQTQGTFTTAWGSQRGQQWSQDENGFVTLTSDYHEQANPFVAALRNPGSPGSGVKLLGVTTGQQPSFVVEMSPRPGIVQRRYYDASTYLLDRIDQITYDGHTRVWEYGDYRRVLGRFVAHTIDYHVDGDPREMHTDVLSYERVSPADVHLEIPASKPLFDLGGRTSLALPAQFTNDGVIVRVSIAGRGLDFLLDTGSSDIVIDPGVARELGMPASGTVVESFAGDFTLANTRAPDLAIGDLHGANVAMAAVNFQEQLQGQRIVGLLGADFIASGVLDVDFKSRTLTMLAAAPADLAAKGWSAIPLRLDDDVPLLKAAFSGRDGYFIADLGADDSVLYPHYFSRFSIDVPRGTQDQGEMITLGGRPFGIKHFTMNRLVLGDWIFGDVQVVVPSASYAQQLDYDGLIGRSTLANFNLIFDYKNRQLWFKPIDFGS